MAHHHYSTYIPLNFSSGPLDDVMVVIEPLGVSLGNGPLLSLLLLHVGVIMGPILLALDLDSVTNTQEMALEEGRRGRRSSFQRKLPPHHHMRLLGDPVSCFHHDLLKQVVAKLGLEIEELKKSAHCLIDILATATPSKMALPIIVALVGPVKAL